MSTEPASTSWSELADRLTTALHPLAAPVAISFLDTVPDDVPAFDSPMPEPTPDGRTGRVAAGCVFWMHAPDRTFSTVAADHANCSVGSYTHGLLGLEEAATHADIGALVKSGWVTPDVFPTIPAVTTRPAAIVYGPLAETQDPSVILLRLNAQAMMVMSDALPDLRIEGKPQCHIIAVAHEQHRVAASVGCALSRARTGMGANAMTCAIPAAMAAEVTERVERAAGIDSGVARYAATDAQRFR
ncbi:MAG TPA: DUF169 domain-containing protein [Candidatus Dormibacteraeota bacterium]